MSRPTNVVSLHPYFKAHPGKLPAIRGLLDRFVAQTQGEPLCLGYEFTLEGDVIFCREAYAGAAGALAHVQNVGPLIDEMLTLSDLVRLEVHGPAEELDQLRGPMAGLKPAWFVRVCGIAR